jgi:Txe/YoeB family toxin of Txe-Axe toxin-antitoxin module
MKHNCRINGVFAPALFANRYDRMKAVYKRQIARMNKYIDFLCASDIEALRSELKEEKDRRIAAEHRVIQLTQTCLNLQKRYESR